MAVNIRSQPRGSRMRKSIGMSGSLLRTLFCLTLATAPQAFANRTGFQSFGGVPVESNQTLIFGGSFSPPTMEHMGLVTRLMARFGFSKAKMVVASPYKKGAAPAEVSLGSTRTAVEHADEVLVANSINHSHFARTGVGVSAWTGSEGRRFELSVDDIEIRTNTKENALKTIRLLRQRAKSAKENFWLAGGDSFASVPTWTPEWRELFDHCNWIVVSRAGFDTGEKAVRFHEKNPLLRSLGEDFLKNYNYSFDQTNQMHVYRNLDSAKPDIFVVDQPALQDSSSDNRKSLAAGGDREHAQAGLQPSVFKECVKNGYFAKTENGITETGYNVFSRKNLEAYLRWLFSQVEGRHSGKLTTEELTDFHEMTEVLIQLAAETARETTDRPRVVAAAVFVYEHLAEYISELRDIRNISKHIREAAKKYGIKTFATVYVALEIAETTVFPAFMYHVAGPAGLALAPFMHPNEVITIPAYIAWRVWRTMSEKKRRAGSLDLYKELTNFRNRLLRGDPEAIVARVKLKQDLGLSDTQLTLNIVKSRLPKWIPLPVRQWDDRRIKWHDLNISTNELASILGNPGLSAELEESAGDDKGLYGNLLLSAVLQDPKAKLLLELFVATRYFRNLAFGDVSEELLGGFGPEVQKEIREIQVKTQLVRLSFNSADRELLSEVIGLTYAVARALDANPNLKNEPGFWQMVYDLAAVKYPGKSAPKKLSNAQQLTQLLLNQALEILLLRDQSEAPVGSTTKSADEAMRAEVLKNTLRDYLSENIWIFLRDTKTDSPAPSKERFDLLRNSSRGEELSLGNVLWEMRLFKEYVTREFQTLESGFERSVFYLKTRPQHKRTERMFWQALDRVDDNLTALHIRLRDLEYAWLREKYPHQFGATANNESAIHAYKSTVQKYRALQQEFEHELEIVRTLNQMMQGVVAIDVNNPVEVRYKLGSLLELSSRSQKRLGFNVCERLLIW